MAQIKGKQIAGGSVDPNKLASGQTGAGYVVATNGSGTFATVALSGDATVSAAGALTVSNSAISGAKIADNGIPDGKLAVADINFDLGSASSYPRIKLTGTTTQADDVASKAYVDSQVISSSAGLSPKDSVYYRSKTAVAGTYNNSAGTITGSSNGAIAAADIGATGLTVAQGETVLLTAQSPDVQNGIYEITTLGDGSTPFVLTRRGDADTVAKLAGAYVFSMLGDYADKGYLCTTDPDAVLGTDSITWTDFSILSLEGGAGISVSNNAITADLAVSSGLTSAGGAGSQLAVKLPTSSGLEINGTAGLKIDAADASLDLSANGVKVNSDGESVTLVDSKIAAATLETADLDRAVTSAVSSGTGTTGLTISYIPAANSAVMIYINGVQTKLGAATSDPVFFSDGSGGARAFKDIVANDALHFNVSAAGYALETTDEISMSYQVARNRG
jgi:hypothetical protein